MLNNETPGRTIRTDGLHTSEVLTILRGEIPSTESIEGKALQIIEQSVDPTRGVIEQPSDGLLYGLIQSGKTSIITVATAMAADNGFQCLVVLTSDIDLLYEQTLERVRKVLRGLNVLGKNDWRDPQRFEAQLRTPPFVVVCSKNGSKLNSLLDAFKSARAGNLSALIIDDEADQASLNTLTSKRNNQISKINEVITNFRGFFRVNTYIQVTATPQALFLQRPDHPYRPSFTVLSEPGPGYVGGEAFFGSTSNLLRNVDLNEVSILQTTHQPTPTGIIPTGLKTALYTFLIAATSKAIQNPAKGYAFLCHVSVSQRDHNYIVNLIDGFKENTINILLDSTTRKYTTTIGELQTAYADLSQTCHNLPSFDSIIDRIKFWLHGANIKLINASTNEEIRLDSVYNIFVGGNKLGRGVTIKNLLVSYYGRNPQRPNSDTVLQHARMYGYRQNDLDVTRLFLPERLANHFRLIHQMETALRELVARHPQGKFEGIFISTPLRATRSNVLDPNSIGMYVAGGYCNPSYPLRIEAIRVNTQWIDQKLASYNDTAEYHEITINYIIEMLQKCEHDPNFGAELWDKKTITSALEKIQTLSGPKAYLRIRKNRDLNESRRETQGFLSGGEEALVPADAPTLFIYRLNTSDRGEEVWWPMIRFPEGNYALAFSFNR